MPAGITYVLASLVRATKKCVACLPKRVHAQIYVSYRQRQKRTGRVFSRLSHVQGPVENHAQIPKVIFVMKGGTVSIKNRNIFTHGVEMHNFGLGSVDN
jgi:hypothetical protein